MKAKKNMIRKRSAARSTITMLAWMLLVATNASGQTTLYVFDGDSAGDGFGYSVSGTGDVNADGYDDFIVGASDDDNNGDRSGSARVFSGLDGSVLYTFNGVSAGAVFGRSVSGVGDLNADGFDDLIVGAVGSPIPTNSSSSARVFSGSDGSVLYTFNGDSPWDNFGISVSGVGDVNADGVPDFIVGAHGDNTNGLLNSGTARVFSGVDGSILYVFSGDSAGDFLGYSVSGTGDVNADGVPDMIVGAHSDDNNGTNSGSARVFSGVDGSILYEFNGDSSHDLFGWAVSGADDVNADGFADVIVGAHGDDTNGTNSGSVRVFSGLDGSILHTFHGDSAGDQFGKSVSGAGDINADGVPDLIVGATLVGRVRVFSGVDGSILHTFDGDFSFGWAVDGAGDVNADGVPDLIVGATFDDTNGLDSGSAWVISPLPGSPPVFVTQPVSQSVNPGDPARFSVAVDGFGPLSYQWRKDGIEILGATWATFSIMSAQESDEGAYDCVATSEFESATSAVATLTVYDPVEMLINVIQDLQVLNLQEGISNTLDAKLDAVFMALDDLNENNDVAATNSLDAFINAVLAQSGKKISESDAAALVVSAQVIIDTLNGL